MTQPLPAAITDVLPPNDNMRIGTVSATNPLTIDVQGAPVAAGRLGSYFPESGEPVALLRQDQSWLALGSVVAGTLSSGKNISQVLYAQASANLNLNAASATIPGTTITFDTQYPNALMLSFWVADIEAILAGATLGQVRLSVDGVIVNPNALFNQANTAAGMRMTVAQHSVRTLAATGTHTVLLNGIRGAGADNTVRANATHTTLLVVILE